MRSQSMCPTGADSLSYEESVYSGVPEESIEIYDQNTGEYYYMKRISESVDQEMMSPAPPSRSESVMPPPAIEKKEKPSTRELERPSPLVLDGVSKKKVMAPPVHYDLRTGTPEQVCNHIDYVVKFDLASPEYLANLKQQLYARHQKKPIVFGYIPAPPNETITRKIIGANGYFLKMTTACCGIYFIWYDSATNTFLFWGPSTFTVVKALNSIRWRIFKYFEAYQLESAQAARSQSPPPESDDDDDEYADMPGLISSGNTPDYEHPEQC
jgi:hypothetical protein